MPIENLASRRLGVTAGSSIVNRQPATGNRQSDEVPPCLTSATPSGRSPRRPASRWSPSSPSRWASAAIRPSSASSWRCSPRSPSACCRRSRRPAPSCATRSSRAGAGRPRAARGCARRWWPSRWRSRSSCSPAPAFSCAASSRSSRSIPASTPEASSRCRRRHSAFSVRREAASVPRFSRRWGGSRACRAPRPGRASRSR